MKEKKLAKKAQPIKCCTSKHVAPKAPVHMAVSAQL